MENENAVDTSVPADHEYFFSVDDLYAMREVISTCTKHGLIDPSAMVIVGNLYNKIDNIIKAETTQELLLEE